MRTQADQDTFTIRQAYALRECDLKREGLAAILDAMGERSRGWWPW